MKKLYLHKYGRSHPVYFHTSKYSKNGNLYVGLMTYEEGFPEPWSDLTVNLGIKCKSNCAFIDTNNNGEEIVEWLFSNGFAILTGRMQSSGWCVYPEMKFNLEAISAYMEMVTDDESETETPSYWDDGWNDNRKGNYSEFGGE